MACIVMAYIVMASMGMRQRLCRKIARGVDWTSFYFLFFWYLWCRLRPGRPCRIVNYRHVCVGMCVDMCVDLCIDMYAGMCAGMCEGMCEGMCVDIC